MKRITRTTALIVALILMLISAVTLTACKGKSLNEAQRREISSELTKYIARSNISGSVYIVYRGDVVLDIAQGVQSEKGSDIMYGAASLTKQFTAACILKLYEAGKLDIKDPLSKYFPEYRCGNDISIDQLLCQRSGIPDYEIEYSEGTVTAYCLGSDDKAEIKAENTAAENRDTIRELIFSRELLFEPGSRFDYSDSNYALLAAIIEQTSGVSFHDFVRENIFEPLGMNASFIDEPIPENALVAPATDRKDFDDDYFRYKGAEFGCGDLLISTDDLYKWYRGLTGGSVISDSSYDLMTENYSSENELGYGFGLMISEEDDAKTLYHFGYIPSYYSAVFMIPEYDIFVAALTDSSKGYPHYTAAEITKRLSKEVELEITDIE